jgi:hypothetical protein
MFPQSSERNSSEDVRSRLFRNLGNPLTRLHGVMVQAQSKSSMPWNSHIGIPVRTIWVRVFSCLVHFTSFQHLDTLPLLHRGTIPTGKFSGRAEETHKFLVFVGVVAEIRTEHSPNTCLHRCCYTNPFIPTQYVIQYTLLVLFTSVIAVTA